MLNTRDGICEADVNGLGVGVMWRAGTARTDQLRCIAVEGVAGPRPEAVFRLKDRPGALLDAFFSASLPTPSRCSG